MLFLITLLQQMSAKPCTVTVNGKNIAPTNVAHIEDIEKVETVSYIEGSRTWDTLRYATTGSYPLTTRFTDRYNNEWTVSLNDSNSQVTLCIPSNTEIYWHGDEGDRTGFDAQTEWAQVTFSHADGTGFPTYHSHGIRIEATAYSLDDIKENNIDERRWTAILDDATKGVAILKSLADIAVEMAVPEAGAAEKVEEEAAAEDVMKSGGGEAAAEKAAQKKASEIAAEKATAERAAAEKAEAERVARRKAAEQAEEEEERQAHQRAAEKAEEEREEHQHAAQNAEHEREAAEKVEEAQKAEHEREAAEKAEEAKKAEQKREAAQKTAAEEASQKTDSEKEAAEEASQKTDSEKNAEKGAADSTESEAIKKVLEALKAIATPAAGTTAEGQPISITVNINF